ncbi:MarR family transcriptional regulator [Actinokineospora sp. NBRC 105648]|uniref:MarR family winged helix-turn-helix transcriptional regulator n=1 Tax=Actinokineospora sp. NBRC 105648 TaxID=3032206 RepID=UPI0024A5899E|nr:MarR family transcriptional regulator [Actinokineospora sp. NBRC 105648]GLZ40201.1 transcriptional regulator [Actinokineospora sp. NBRC 105648]
MTPVTPWLDPEQQRSWRALVEGAGQLLARVDRHLRDTHGLTLAEYEILVRLSEGHAHMSELATQVSHSRARLSQTVDRLVRAGLVERSPCPEDRRGVHATLTERGAGTLAAAARDHVLEVRRLVVDVLSADELTAVGTAMAKVAAATDQPEPGDHTEPSEQADGPGPTDQTV